jgi:hypothetical protein
MMDIIISMDAVVFKIPFFRDFGLWCGFVDAGRKTAERQLDESK